ncbi:hypothetical protein glysoja_033003 [Glycine soja]|uniref:Uncharacterized protein n=1 Tax=Glycine soja TaxID=3848 RepID=A0A0B2R2F6_GLYSO|nr:hypothetical protein glysoja_033003 [Glycine soja]
MHLPLLFHITLPSTLLFYIPSASSNPFMAKCPKTTPTPTKTVKPPSPPPPPPSIPF